MTKFDYRWFGIGALGVFAAVSLTGSASLLRMLPPSYGAATYLLGGAVSIILAEIWAVIYWRTSRDVISATTLGLLNVAIVCNLIYLVPVFMIIIHRLFG